MEEEYIEEELSVPDGVYPINLSENSQKRLNCVLNWDISALEPIKVLPMGILLREIEENPSSDLAKISKAIQNSKVEDAFLFYDETSQFGSKFLLCLTEQAKFRFEQLEENKDMELVDKTAKYVYRPPIPGKWNNLGSDKEIERDWVKDTRSKIQILVKRSKPRTNNEFVDRNVADVVDGYVACEAYSDTTKWSRVDSMERGMQAVPVLMDGSSQTELKYPKNIFCQYEARVFTEEEIRHHWESEEMKNFVVKVSKIFDEINQDPDIMGEFKDDIIAFYRRDEVVEVEQSEMVETLAFSDLTFTNNMKVNHIRWHPTIEGVVAMSVMENLDLKTYLINTPDRTVSPNFLLLWSEAHPIVPQLLLRIPDDITKFEWHPEDPGILIGGCFNGQIVVWDIEEYLFKLKTKTCIWKYDVILSENREKLHPKEGFIPVLHWSAESKITHSHRFMVEDLKWLPSDVRFSTDSAYPRLNDDQNVRQFVSCSSADLFILVWGFEPPSEDVEENFGSSVAAAASIKIKVETESNWERLRRLYDTSSSSSNVTPDMGPRRTMAIGKYKFLDQVWSPIHKISFLEDHTMIRRAKREFELLRVQICSIAVQSRPDRVYKKGDFRTNSSEEKDEEEGEGGEEENDEDVDEAEEEEDDDVKDGKNMGNKDVHDKVSKNGKIEKKIRKKRKKNRESVNKNYRALPVDFIGGTFTGGIFKADLSRVKVEVESGDLHCIIEWYIHVHDGPSKFLEPSPFNKNVLLSMGGYSVAIWKSDALNKPVILHFAEYDEEFTYAAWSLTRPAVFFLSGHLGNLQVWMVTSRQSVPFFKQNISGKTISAICPYEVRGSETHYVSVGDWTGTLRLLSLPREVWQPEDNELEQFEKFILRELELVREKDRKVEALNSPTTTALQKTTSSITLSGDDIEPWKNESDFWIEYFSTEEELLKAVFGVSWKVRLKNFNISRDRYVVSDESFLTNSSFSSSSKSGSLPKLSKKSSSRALRLLKAPK